MIPLLFAPLHIQISKLFSLPQQLGKNIAAELEELKSSMRFEELEETAIPSYTHSFAPIRYVFLKRLKIALAVLKENLLLKCVPVLDFGCGAGLMTLLLKENEFLPWRTDIRPEVCIPSAQACSAVAPSNTDFSQFRACMAMDVLEHLSETELHAFSDGFASNTLVVVSGPTENLIYRCGRKIAGFKGGYHQRNIYQILRLLEGTGWIRKSHPRMVLSRFYCPAFLIACLRKNNAV